MTWRAGPDRPAIDHTLVLIRYGGSTTPWMFAVTEAAR